MHNISLWQLAVVNLLVFLLVGIGHAHFNERFLCMDRHEIRAELICDGQYDCTYGEDESYCDANSLRFLGKYDTTIAGVRN